MSTLDSLLVRLVLIVLNVKPCEPDVSNLANFPDTDQLLVFGIAKRSLEL